MHPMLKRMMFALLIALPVTVGVAAVAQPADQGERRMHRRGKHHKKGLKILLKTIDEVGVSDEVQGNIKAHLKAKKPELKALRKQMKKARQSGDPIVMQEAKLKMMEKRLEVTSDIRAFLTEAQWNAVVDKLQEKRAKFKERRRAKRKAMMELDDDL